MKPEILRLYAVTDRMWLGDKTLAWQIEQAIKGGATCVQLREKLSTKEEIIEIAASVQDVCRKYHIPFIINDSPELAVLCDADGVHIGQNDGDILKARKIIGNERILGVSARTLEDAKVAERQGADYIGAGAVFSTSTKNGAQVISLDTLREITAGVKIPVTAIGGIDESNIKKLMGSGICGAAVVSGIFSSEDIEGTCRRLRTALDNLKYQIDGAMFDMDGTLLDSMHIWHEAAANYLKTKGIKPKSNIYERISRVGLTQAANILKTEYDIEDSADRILCDMEEVLCRMYTDLSQVKPGVKDFLRFLKEKGTKICVATSCGYDLARTALEKNGLLSYIDRIFTCSEFGEKDSPVIYNKALEYLKTDKKSTWVFEDAKYCVKTAKNAGFHVCGIWDRYEKNSIDVKEYSDIYIKTFEGVSVYFD